MSRFAIGKLPMSIPGMVIPGVGEVVLGVVVPAVFDDGTAAMEVEIMLIEGTVMLYVGSIEAKYQGLISFRGSSSLGVVSVQ